MNSESKQIFCQLLNGPCTQEKPGDCGKQTKSFLGRSKPCPVAKEFLSQRRNTILDLQKGMALYPRPYGDDELNVDFAGYNGEKIPGEKVVDSISVGKGIVAINGLKTDGNWGDELPKELVDFVMFGVKTRITGEVKNPDIYNN